MMRVKVRSLRIVLSVVIGFVFTFWLVFNLYPYSRLGHLSKIAKHLQKAKLHSRGLKSRDNIQLAINEIDELLKEKGSSFHKVTERRSLDTSPSVCPEHYTDPDYGFPLFELGYVETDCPYGKPIEDLITIVMVYDQDWSYSVTNVLRQIFDYSSKLHVLLAIPAAQKATIAADLHSNVQFFTTAAGRTIGKIYNNLISQVTTPYTLVAPFVHIFHKDSRLHRLIREIELLDLDIAGGSFRNSSDIWHMGCYQRIEFNYTLVYREGYDESFHDCIFCDHIDGPFVAKTTLLKQNKFNEEFSMIGLFEDFFLSISGEMVVCPDSMFYIHKAEKKEDPKYWMQFARSRHLARLSWSEFLNIDFDCKYDYPCSAVAGHIIHPCCVNELRHLTNYILDTCENEKIFCEPHGGTILGPIKMRDTLPWERDTDIRVVNYNFTNFLSLEDIIVSEGFNVTHKQPSTVSCPSIPRGYININTLNWKSDVYAYCNISSVEALKSGLGLTKMWHHNTLINVPRNPGLAARNRYPGLYRHAEHCSVLGIGVLDVYGKHGFMECEKETLCLSRFNMDGNLQFFIGVLP